MMPFMSGGSGLFAYEWSTPATLIIAARLMKPEINSRIHVSVARANHHDNLLIENPDEGLRLSPMDGGSFSGRASGDLLLP